MSLELPKKQNRPLPTGVPPGGVYASKKPVSRSGWHSTKLHLALIGMALLTMVFITTVAVTKTATGWAEYVLGEVSMAGIYATSRVGESFAQRGQKKEEDE